MIVYCATNQANGKRYVGVTTRSIAFRMGQHRRKAELGTESAFYRAIRKHGWDAFSWEVLETLSNSHELHEAEKRWIDQLCSLVTAGGYNIKHGEYGMPGWTHAVSDSTKEKISASLLGKKHTQDRIEKNRISASVRVRSGETFKPRKNSRYGIAGIYWDKNIQKWSAYITPNRKRKNIGYFADFFDAVCARKSAENDFFAGRL